MNIKMIRGIRCIEEGTQEEVIKNHRLKFGEAKEVFGTFEKGVFKEKGNRVGSDIQQPSLKKK